MSLFLFPAIRNIPKSKELLNGSPYVKVSILNILLPFLSLSWKEISILKF